MINPQELIDNEESTILSEQEQEAASQLEKWIDEKIRLSYSSRKAVVPDFDENNSTTAKGYHALSKERRKIVKEHIIAKYRTNKWRITWNSGGWGDSGEYLFTPEDNSIPTTR